MQIKSKGNTQSLKFGHTHSYNNLDTRAVIIVCFLFKSVLKVFRINLQLNIYPHNTFYNNLGIYRVIIHITI